MRQRIVVLSSSLFLFLATLAVLPAKSQANTPGWTEIPNTRLRDVCPPNTAEYNFRNNCDAVINAWSGAAFDTSRNRLIIWGGGHNDYYGNEVYTLDPNSLTLERLTDPSSGFTVAGACVDSLPDGRPVSRHTYGGLAYISHADRLFAYGGSQACGSGGFGNDTWTFSFSTLEWENKNPSGPNPGRAIVASAYDPTTKKVFVRAERFLYSYDYDSNTMQQLGGDHLISGFSKSTAVIDPVHRKFVVVGPGGVHLIDLDSGNYTPQKLTTTGPNTIVEDGRSPGLAFDSVRNVIVAWDGSDVGSTPQTVYNLDLDTAQWVAMTASGGPAGGGTTGTFGRWQFVPNLNAFVVVNNVDENAFLFGASTTLIDTTPPTVSLTSPGNGATISDDTTLSASASDDNGVAGVKFLVDGLVINSEDTSAPYSTVFNTKTFSNGSHTIIATARDVGGNSVSSSSITVTIDNAEPPPPPIGGALEIPERTWVARNPPGPADRAPTSKGKHTRMTTNPVNGLIYSLGGDHGGTAGAGWGNSGRQEAYTYDVVTEDWREINAYCRTDQGPQPMGPDEVGFPYDPTRGVFWHIPGFGHNHGQRCPSGNAVREKVMQFNPATNSWVDEPAFPNFSRKTIKSIGYTTGNFGFFIYDSVTDAIWAWRNSEVFKYQIQSDTWSRILPNGGPQHLDAGWHTFDPVERWMYSVNNRYDQKLWRFHLDTQVFESYDLPSSVSILRPSNCGGVNNCGAEATGVFDTVNHVLLWPMWFQPADSTFTCGGKPCIDNQIVKLYIWHPDTKTWEEEEVINPTEGPAGLDLSVRGRHVVFDSHNNVLVVMRPKGENGVIPGAAPIFLYRYGTSTGPPPDQTPPTAPKNLTVQ